MEYMLRVLDLEKEIDKLKIVDQNHIKYVDLKRRLGYLNSFARKVSGMDLRESDKCNLLERVEEYKNKIEQYEQAENGLKKRSGITQTIFSFLFGAACLGMGIKVKEIYKLYKNREMDEIASYVYEKISGVESDNE